MADNVDVVREVPQREQLPIDDTVKLPRQVREAKERAEAFYAQPQPQPPQPEPEPPAFEPQAELPIQPQPQPAPAKPPPQDMREVEYAKRYNMMRGRYEEEQRRLEEERRARAQVDAQNAALRAELQRVQNQVVEAPPPRLITPEDEANYGTDLISFVKRASEEVVGPKLSALEIENERLRQMVAEQSRGSMTAALDASVPNWRQVFNDPRFTQWLSLPDVYSGRLRSQLLTEAANAGQSARVVKFYQGFLADEAATGQIDSGSPPSPRQPARKAAISLETIATPGRGHPAGGTPARPGNEKPLITRAQIAEFYSDVRKNLYVGREQQKIAAEAVLQAAIRDGRVLP
jgi:hypothetical protein